MKTRFKVLLVLLVLTLPAFRAQAQAGVPSSTLLAADINPSGLTTNVTFTATVNGVPPLADLPTGNVVFLANGTPFATNALPVGTNIVTASLAALPTGTNYITAEYAGDGNYWANISARLLQVVTNNVIDSQTNVVLSLVNNGDGTFTLNFLGTPGAQYYVVTGGSIESSMASWTAVAGTTNTASTPSGTWSCSVSSSAPAYYRAVAVNPAP